MKQSKYNHIVEINQNKSALVNTLTGAVDIFSVEQLDYLDNNKDPSHNEVVQYLYKRQYLIDDDTDESYLTQQIFSAILQEQRRNTPLRGVIVTTFDCNLRCTYCWQQHNLNNSHRIKMTTEKIDGIFSSIEKLMSMVEYKKDTPPVIQLFGGEPLLVENKGLVEHILKECQKRHWYSQITTNGSQLSNFLDLFEKYDVGEIQITIDGPSEIHDKRRLGSSYKSLMESIDLLLQMDKVHVKLRVNTDLSNIDYIPAIADDIIERQWYTNRKFFSYLSPLRDSSPDNVKLLNQRGTLISKFLNIREAYPQVEIFDVLGWNGFEAVKSLENTGRLPFPKAHICDANMNQFVFTPKGEIHVCAEEAHDSSGMVGSYWPDFAVNKDSFSRWYDKNPLELQFCKNCSMLPQCCGGCQLFSQDKEFISNFCDSVKASFDYGLKNYFKSEGLI